MLFSDQLQIAEGITHNLVTQRTTSEFKMNGKQVSNSCSTSYSSIMFQPVQELPDHTTHP